MRTVPKLFTVGLGLFVALLVLSLSSVSASPSAIVISGRVVDTQNRGIANIQLESCCYNVSLPVQTYTNADGYYTFTNVPPISPQHVSARPSVNSNLAYAHYYGFQVVEGQTYSNINFTLRPGLGSVSGRVDDGSGTGLAGVFVDFWERTGEGTSGFDNQGYARATTDANGYYKVSITSAPGAGLPTGNYLVTFKKDGYPQRVVDNVWVNAGQETHNVNISMVTGSGSITGKVTSASSGENLANAQIFAQGTNAQVSIFSDNSGNYVLPYLPGGAYHVVVWMDGYASAHRYSVMVQDGQVTSNINFALLSDYGTITGRVANPNGGPIQNAAILADSLQGNGFGNTTTDENGQYVLTGLAPMEYYVHAEAQGYSALVRVEQVADGQTTPNVDFQLGSYNGGISGRVLKGGVPAAGASIYANTSGVATVRYYRAATTDAGGYYMLTSLPPGDYDVHVYDVYGYTPQIRFYVTVDSSVVPNINFDLGVGSAFASGYVRDPSGDPIQNATVEFFQTASPGTWQSTTTNASGYYSVSGLNEGTYNLYVSHLAYPPVSKFNVSLTSSGSQINFVMGLERALVSTPASVVVMIEGDTGTYTAVQVDITSGAPTTWKASTDADWLLLGNTGDVHDTTGGTGQALILRFNPWLVGYGTHTTTVSLIAEDADPYTVTVTMIKAQYLHEVYMPLQAR